MFWKFASKVFIPDEHGELTPLAQAESLNEIPAPPGDIGAAFVKMLLTFVALIALLFGTYWFIRRLIRNRLQKGVGDASIQILEKRMISPKTMLYLVEVENKKILLAESHLEIKRLEGFSSLESPSK
jgi:flagellar biogenesis protein FliO